MAEVNGIPVAPRASLRSATTAEAAPADTPGLLRAPIVAFTAVPITKLSCANPTSGSSSSSDTHSSTSGTSSQDLPPRIPSPRDGAGVSSPPPAIGFAASRVGRRDSEIESPPRTPCSTRPLVPPPSGAFVASAAVAHLRDATILPAGLAAGRSGEAGSRFESPPASPAPHVRPGNLFLACTKTGWRGVDPLNCISGGREISQSHPPATAARRPPRPSAPAAAAMAASPPRPCRPWPRRPPRRPSLPPRPAARPGPPPALGPPPAPPPVAPAPHPRTGRPPARRPPWSLRPTSARSGGVRGITSCRPSPPHRPSLPPRPRTGRTTRTSPGTDEGVLRWSSCCQGQGGFLPGAEEGRGQRRAPAAPSCIVSLSI
nr:leucine-rich repeat extensin-like protein 5 [Lolium perenne]